MRTTKIICTLGPASDKVATVRAMVRAGMDVARLNFSHGTYEHHLHLLKTVRHVGTELKKPIVVMQDLQGPKIRVGKLPKPLAVKPGHRVTIGKDFTSDFDFSKFVKPGERVLVEDGLIELTVKRAARGFVFCTVEAGGLIQEHKGINLPDSRLPFSGLTEKDRRDLAWGLSNRVDLVAISFVRSAKDVAEARAAMKKIAPKLKRYPPIVVKIEKPEAVKSFSSILKAADWVMVARGDLGVEIHLAEVPIIQKHLVALTRKAKKPAIVATQMLESMVKNPVPTRAEVSDIANAVLDGATHVMLSGETAFGGYPVNAVAAMADIVQTVETARTKRRVS